MEVKMKVMRKAIIMMIQMMNTNKMFSINRMLLDSMFLTIKLKQINFRNLLKPAEHFFKIAFKLNSQLKRK